MAFDGIFISQLVQELAPILIGARIDKIHQPEKDELSLITRGKDQSYTLFISVESALPYFAVTTQKKENPKAAPMFCMLMRKHIAGGRIFNISQHGNERVVIIEIEAKNELGELEKKKLIIEIMGKHSNLILTKEDFTIIDSIKRITPDLSRVRLILPGLKYEYLESNKILLRDVELEFKQALDAKIRATPQMKTFKCLYEIIEGFSPLASKIVLNALDMSFDNPIGQLTSQDGDQLLTGLIAFRADLRLEGFVYYGAFDIPRELYFIGTLHEYDHIQKTDTLNAAVDLYYGSQNKQLKNHQRAHDLKKRIQQRLDRSESKLRKLQMELETAENSEIYKVQGELILANIYRLHKGMNVATLENYYSETNETLDIPLDIRLDPSENAQKFFKRYNKLKTARLELKTQIKETDDEVAYLDQVLTLLNNIEEPSELDSIKQELAEEGFIKVKKTKQKSKPTKEIFKYFISSDGFEIIVGKNNKQNDQLTTKVASNKDMWLHTKIIPGSHVIIRTEGTDIPEKTLTEAAIIAAYHSKARESSNVPVDYTLIKNVSKPNGAKPGMVIYVQNKTLYVTPDEALIQHLKK
ncbi:NFACT family protein [Fusibacter sp. 3D3]|uniref:Rqc2 family fibronectin-binding protein n=1 Tax=Fusibacter sp. 3D3 TaxID=1048380 RepID=UPI000853B50C|nr:NFACT RNA binding domain-containing protein [Fusibacter sp. 3D3]GAU78736.1 fibronectin/fibrinogen-binding protein [Fusibacter sp. 3D3]